MLFFTKLHGEEREVHFAIVSMLPEVRMLFELVFARMLEDEDAVVGEDIAGEDDVGQLRQVLEGVGRVGKDDVESFVGTFQEVEDIGADSMEVVHAHAGGGLFDEINALVVDVDGGDLFRPTGDELERHSSCACKEVHDSALFIVDIVVEDVEEAFTCHVGSGTDRQRGGGIESTASE